jgi:SAM-dependent methyltransferase
VVACADGALVAAGWWRWQAGRPANFDFLAAHYRWMEWVLAGRKLQRCREAFLGSIPPPGRALLVGEGNGRFLAALRRAYPQVQCVCVDASARMLERARMSSEAAGLGVEGIPGKQLGGGPPPGKRNEGHFDLIRLFEARFHYDFGRTLQ